MKVTKVNVLFWLRKNYINRKSKCQIWCSVSANGTKKDFSTGLYTEPENFDQRRQRAKGKGSNYINYKLSQIESFLLSEAIRLELNQQPVTPENLKHQFFLEYSKTLQLC